MKRRTKQIHPVTVPEEVLGVMPDAITGARAARILGIGRNELGLRAKDGIYKFVTCNKGWKWYSRSYLVAIMNGVDSTLNEDQPPPEEPNVLGQIIRRGMQTKHVPRSAEVHQARSTLIELQRMQQQEAEKGGRMAYSGEDAKLVFKALHEGKTAVEAIMETGVHPHKVRWIEADWHQLRGDVWISREAVERIEALPLVGERPIKTEEELLEILIQNYKPQESAMCGRCNARPARVCADCFAAMLRDIAGQAKQEIYPSGETNGAATGSVNGSAKG